MAHPAQTPCSRLSKKIWLTFQGLPRSTRFLESLVGYLPEWRKALSPLPVILWQDFMGHVRENLNPLAADDHMKEVIQQLQLMGEVLRFKKPSCFNDDKDCFCLRRRWCT